MSKQQREALAKIAAMDSEGMRADDLGRAAAIARAALSAPAEQARQTGYVAPVGKYVLPVLFSPYTGDPRDARDIATDPQGILIVPPGAAMLAASPSAPTAVQPATPVPEGMVLAPHYRGYARLGIGAYLINHSAQGEPAELIISIASEEDKEGRTVGDLRDNPEGRAIQPEEMAVRIRFENVAGLDALEQQLRLLRKAHFAASISEQPADWRHAAAQFLRARAEERSSLGLPTRADELWGAADLLDQLAMAAPYGLDCIAPTAVQPCPDAAHMAEHACSNAAQCWEPCGQLGKSEEHARAVSAEEEPEVYSALAALTAVHPAAPVPVGAGDGSTFIAPEQPVMKVNKPYHLSSAEQGALNRALLRSHRNLDAAQPAAQVQEAGGVDARPGDSHAFKNFHRSLCARFGYTHDEQHWRRDLVSLEEHIAARAAQPATPVAPIDMVLHCPACGMQHIDAPEFEEYAPGHYRYRDGWDNPPHRSHRCHGCGHIWRPADVPTNGVAAVKTKGKADSSIATPVAPKTLEALTDEEAEKVAEQFRSYISSGDDTKAAIHYYHVQEFACDLQRALAAKNGMTLGGDGA